MEENTKKKKKMSMQEWCMHYRQIIILLVSCLVALGVFGLANINKNEFPDFTIRQGIVVAVYPGVTSQEMEEQVTKPLEKYIFTYREVKKEKTVSYSRDGVCIIQAYWPFRSTTTSATPLPYSSLWSLRTKPIGNLTTT